MKQLLIPEKADAERLAVAEAWQAAGGKVLKIGKFWELPVLETDEVVLYGNDTFCLVIAEKLGLHLVSPADDLLIKIDKKWLKRKITVQAIHQLQYTRFPVFIKPLVPKQFKAGIYADLKSVEAETAGLPDHEKVYCSDLIDIEAEARFFIAASQLISGAVYEGEADLDEFTRFAEAFLRENEKLLPQTVVLDFGFNPQLGCFLIEANATWGAGLNGCQPEKVISCLALATQRNKM